ncbi:MAG: hypothetical protein L0216_17500 [Planctomycetales bacterium]|nr:hypothetical protein [Planctomycetales bacterium]
MREPRSLLFVCSGNMCRSALAEHYAARALREMGRDDVSVASAGTLGMVGQPPFPLTLVVAEEEGLDLSAHRSRALSPYLVKEADAILVMTPGHREQILELHPDAGKKIQLLGSYRPGKRKKDEDASIADPVGNDLEHFRSTFSQIREAVDFLLARTFGPKGKS